MLGIGLAIVAGVLFGNTFTPVNAVKQHQHGPKEDLSYVFSHFTGTR